MPRKFGPYEPEKLSIDEFNKEIERLEAESELRRSGGQPQGLPLIDDPILRKNLADENERVRREEIHSHFNEERTYGEKLRANGKLSEPQYEELLRLIDKKEREMLGDE